MRSVIREIQGSWPVILTAGLFGLASAGHVQIAIDAATHWRAGEITAAYLDWALSALYGGCAAFSLFLMIVTLAERAVGSALQQYLGSAPVPAPIGFAAIQAYQRAETAKRQATTAVDSEINDRMFIG